MYRLKEHVENPHLTLQPHCPLQTKIWAIFCHFPQAFSKTAGRAESASSLSNIPPYRDEKLESWAAMGFFTAGVFGGLLGLENL
ncbi:hypothetical protein K443DRAFT_684212 [Laccaria amethystina LaAM-08-1]|uniref:Uncharacterized protein n=1 Tax=Laccaria amethystina LaAM-08-1 TaxID=1095629 RepID=A0A0C9XC41_9AGAR|nr:hypothetical protein K443DRAFT_684212 [Laccaria amethystina LaAM-08-1]